jgi:hypothetical protein
MTDEAGAITGDLELLTHLTPAGNAIEMLVRYAGTWDLYTVAGSPVLTATLSEHPDQVDRRAAHERILERLKTPGRVESGNETASADFMISSPLMSEEYLRYLPNTEGYEARELP